MRRFFSSVALLFVVGALGLGSLALWHFFTGGLSLDSFILTLREQQKNVLWALLALGVILFVIPLLWDKNTRKHLTLLQLCLVLSVLAHLVLLVGFAMKNISSELIVAREEPVTIELESTVAARERLSLDIREDLSDLPEQPREALDRAVEEAISIPERQPLETTPEFVVERDAPSPYQIAPEEIRAPDQQAISLPELAFNPVAPNFEIETVLPELVIARAAPETTEEPDFQAEQDVPTPRADPRVSVSVPTEFPTIDVPLTAPETGAAVQGESVRIDPELSEVEWDAELPRPAIADAPERASDPLVDIRMDEFQPRPEQSPSPEAKIEAPQFSRQNPDAPAPIPSRPDLAPTSIEPVVFQHRPIAPREAPSVATERLSEVEGNAELPRPAIADAPERASDPLVDIRMDEFQPRPEQPPSPEAKIEAPQFSRQSPDAPAPISSRPDMASTSIEPAVFQHRPIAPWVAPSIATDPLEALPAFEIPIELPTLEDQLALEVASMLAEESFALRDPEKRKELVEQLGGSKETEAAIVRALDWLTKTQEADGRWDMERHNGERGHDMAATGLALLSYMGWGATHLEEGPYHSAAKKALEFLLQEMKPDGDLRQDGNMYDHGIAAIAIIEAYAMTRDPSLKEPAQRVVDFTLKGQHATAGGWRYAPGDFPDTSVSGWCIMALVGARKAGLEVPESAFTRANGWLDQMAGGLHGGKYGYDHEYPERLVMTAEAMFCRQLLGHSRGANMDESAAFLATALPSVRGADYYYWYYGSLALYQHKGKLWEDWNNLLRTILIVEQERRGKREGSWRPAGDYANRMGTVVSTAFGALCLEVYYRYLPMVKEAP